MQLAHDNDPYTHARELKYQKKKKLHVGCVAHMETDVENMWHVRRIQ